MIKRNKLYLAALLLLMSCQVNTGDEDKKDKKDPTLSLTGEVEFSGYVQKAFDISVNDQSFNDSEDFYTHFIERLIASNPKYQKALTGAKIKIEGQYGLDTFGSNAGVFLSSMAKSGHLFQSSTNGQGKFSIRVKADAQDEQFKAKVVLRIGLLIEYPGVQNADHFCYLLFGQQDNISINNSTKPIIFDAFTTQLDTYRCEEHASDKLIIPTKDGEDNAGVVVPGQDGKMPEEAGNPHIIADDPIQIVMPLSANEIGANTLLSAFHAPTEGAYYFLKGKITSKVSGDVYHPLISLSDLSKPVLKQIKIEPETDQYVFGIGDFVKFQDNFYFSDSGEASYRMGLGVYDKEGMFQASIEPKYDDFSQRLQSVSLFAGRDGVSVFGKASNGYASCKMNTNAANPYTGCRLQADSQKNSIDGVRSITQFGDLLFVLAKDASKITVLNMNLVEQATYTVSKLMMPRFELDGARLFSDGKGLLFASMGMDAKTLKIRRIQLVEK